MTGGGMLPGGPWATSPHSRNAEGIAPAPIY